MEMQETQETRVRFPEVQGVTATVLTAVRRGDIVELAYQLKLIHRLRPAGMSPGDKQRGYDQPIHLLVNVGANQSPACGRSVLSDQL